MKKTKAPTKNIKTISKKYENSKADLAADKAAAKKLIKKKK